MNMRDNPDKQLINDVINGWNSVCDEVNEIRKEKNASLINQTTDGEDSSQTTGESKLIQYQGAIVGINGNVNKYFVDKRGRFITNMGINGNVNKYFPLNLQYRAGLIKNDTVAVVFDRRKPHYIKQLSEFLPWYSVIGKFICGKKYVKIKNSNKSIDKTNISKNDGVSKKK